MELGNRQDLVKLFEERGYKVGAEVGVRQGRFSEFILLNTSINKLYSIDPWTPNVELSSAVDECDRIYAGAVEILKQFGERSEIVRDFSQSASFKFADASLDFVYIDALHDYDSVTLDIELFYPKVRSGGIIAGHDYDEQAWPGVFRAVNEFVDRNQFSVDGLQLHTTGLGDCWGESDGGRKSWWLVKP